MTFANQETTRRNLQSLFLVNLYNSLAGLLNLILSLQQLNLSCAYGKASLNVASRQSELIPDTRGYFTRVRETQRERESCSSQSNCLHQQPTIEDSIVPQISPIAGGYIDRANCRN